MKIEQELQDKLSFAKNRLVLDHVFYANLLLNNEIIWVDNDSDVKTLATDMVDIFINVDFARTLERKTLIQALMHEVLHKVFLHGSRSKNRVNGNDGKWQYACDYAINPIVIEETGAIPNDWVYDKQYEGMSAEEIYKLLPDGDYSDAENHVRPAKGRSDSQQKALEQTIKQQVASAKIMAKKAGKLSASLEKFIDDLLDSKVDWTEQLRNLIQRSSGVGNQTWSRLNRRFIGQGIYLPSTYSENTPPLIIMFDTSGSIYSQTELLKEFNTEINAIIEDTSPSAVHIIMTDTQVQSHDELDQGDEFIPKLKGGGGTDFTEFFNYVLDNDIEASTIVAFTDLYASGLPDDYHIPIIWAVYENDDPKPPFGDVIIVK